MSVTLAASKIAGKAYRLLAEKLQLATCCALDRRVISAAAPVFANDHKGAGLSVVVV